MVELALTPQLPHLAGATVLSLALGALLFGPRQIAVLLRVGAIGGAIFGVLLYARPELLSSKLGEWLQPCAMLSLVAIALALGLACLRALKSGVVIGFWSALLILVGYQAFPGAFAESHDRLVVPAVERIERTIREYR